MTDKTDAERDYEDMRKFQMKFIDCDQRCRRLQVMLEIAEEVLSEIMKVGTTGHGNTIEGYLAYKVLGRLETMKK